MSQGFSFSSDPASQSLTPEEARELIRGYAEPGNAPPAGITVGALAETLGISNEQAQDMVRNLRARQTMPQPLPNSVWLKTRLWIWVLLAVIALSLSGFGILGSIADKAAGLGTPAPNRTVTRGIYSEAVAAQGRALGAKAPPGFSYRIQYGTMDAGVNGDSKKFIDVEDLSSEGVALLQLQMAEDIMKAIDSAIKIEKPNWVEGKAPAVIVPNYYDGGFGESFDLTLEEKAFPYKPETFEGQKVRGELLADLKQHWDDIID